MWFHCIASYLLGMTWESRKSNTDASCFNSFKRHAGVSWQSSSHFKRQCNVGVVRFKHRCILLGLQQKGTCYWQQLCLATYHFSLGYNILFCSIVSSIGNEGRVYQALQTSRWCIVAVALSLQTPVQRAADGIIINAIYDRLVLD